LEALTGRTDRYPLLLLYLGFIPVQLFLAALTEWLVGGYGPWRVALGGGIGLVVAWLFFWLYDRRRLRQFKSASGGSPPAYIARYKAVFVTLSERRVNFDANEPLIFALCRYHIEAVPRDADHPLFFEFFTSQEAAAKWSGLTRALRNEFGDDGEGPDAPVRFFDPVVTGPASSARRAKDIVLERLDSYLRKGLDPSEMVVECRLGTKEMTLGAALAAMELKVDVEMTESIRTEGDQKPGPPRLIVSGSYLVDRRLPSSEDG
jgi:hypothetical protein